MLRGRNYKSVIKGIFTLSDYGGGGGNDYNYIGFRSALIVE